MILADQPDCFPSDIIVAVSSRHDGTMLDKTQSDSGASRVLANRQKFCAEAGGDYEHTIWQTIEYGAGNNYTKIVDVDAATDGNVHADALYTESAGVGLLLPVADCIATVLYDPRRRALMLAHIGRHSSIAKLMTVAIRYMIQKGGHPTDLLIWMAPSAKQASYRMEYFDQLNDPDWRDFVVERDNGVYLDLPGFNTRLALQQGIAPKNIHVSPVDTMTDQHYFSHAAGDINDRFAVLAQIIER